MQNQMTASSTRSPLTLGLREGAPFLIVVIPFAILFGALATEAGLKLPEVLGMSFLVIAGASQFAALNLMTENAPTLVVIATALAVNLRMAMYSASIAPYLGGAGPVQKLVMAYFLVDQSYAQSHAKFEENPGWDLRQRVGYYTGVCLSFCPSWYVATYVGAVIGNAIPPGWGLDMAMPLTFVALVGPMLRSLAHVAAAFVSASLALVFAFLPYNLGLLVAALAALAVGAEIERRRRRA